MALDPSISLQFRPIQLESPLQQAAQAAQVASLRNALLEQERQRAGQAQLKEALSSSGGDLQKALALAIQSGNLSGAARLAPLIEASRKATAPRVVPPGAQVLGPNNEVLHTVPFKPEAESRPEIVTLQRYLDLLPSGDPRRAPIEARIKALGEKQGAVNVYSGSLTAGVDAQGNPVFIQPSGRPDIPPRIVPGVKPPAKETEGGLTPENAGKVAMSQQAIDGVQTTRGILFDEKGNLNRGLVASMNMPLTAGMPGSTQARVARAAMRNAVEAKLRIETGAAATESEVERTLARFLPTVMDTAQSAKFKLDELEKFFRGSLSLTKGIKPPAENADPLGIR